MDKDIIPFAKAYKRYQQGHNPTKLKNEIKAIRCIEPALLKQKGKADITLVDISVLDEAATFAKEAYGDSAYQAGSQLKRLAGFLTDNQLVSKPLSWENPIKKPDELNRTDKKTKQKRAEKLPEDHCLEYMAEMFANDLQGGRDRYAVSTFALLMSAPSRISEVEDLPVDCLHYETDRKGKKRLGLRFYAGKGYGADIKWVLSCFVEIVEEAVARLTQLTEEGRKLATWLEQRPNEFYRHQYCPAVGEDDPLTAEQICAAMGWKYPKSKAASVAFNKASKNKAWLNELRNRNQPITLRILNNHIHENLPSDWPWKNKERGIKYSNALYCMRQDELHATRGVSPVYPWVPNNSAFTHELSARNNVKGWRSVWDRHGYTNPDDSRISMTSHQIRHFLNTAAQRGELGQLDVSKWSGRANVHQNNTYNHVGEYEVLDKVKERGLMPDMSSPLGKVRSHSPVTLEDLDEIGEGIAHVTEFGFCVHDYSMVPCQKHRDCLNCTEQVCVKGDAEKLKRIKRQRDDIAKQLMKADAAEKEGIYGADRWTTHQKRTLERADQLIVILESDEVADGAVVRLRNDQEHSPMKRAIAARSSAPKLESESASKGPDMDQMRALMGGAFG